jgi:hypothetical protein
LVIISQGLATADTIKNRDFIRITCISHWSTISKPRPTSHNTVEPKISSDYPQLCLEQFRAIYLYDLWTYKSCFQKTARVQIATIYTGLEPQTYTRIIVFELKIYIIELSIHLQGLVCGYFTASPIVTVSPVLVRASYLSVTLLSRMSTSIHTKKQNKTTLTAA